MINFKFNPNKTLESLIYIVNNSPIPDVYHTLKILYFSDLLHLESYGRTITGDVYMALEHGPVPANAYDIINYVRNKKPFCPIPNVKDLLSINETDYIINSNRSSKNEVLSDSELECINSAIDKYGKMSFGALKKISHDSAYNSVEQDDIIPIENIINRFVDSEALLVHLKGE